MNNYKDLQDALHIAQVERDKWKARAIKLANILDIRDCDIDSYEGSKEARDDDRRSKRTLCQTNY